MTNAKIYEPFPGGEVPEGWPHLYVALEDYDQLKKALQGLEAMYAKTWDRVDGALVMMPEALERFEAAHSAARLALGQLLDGDAPEPELGS